MLEYKQKRNNGRTSFAGVYKFVCVCNANLEKQMFNFDSKLRKGIIVKKSQNKILWKKEYLHS